MKSHGGTLKARVAAARAFGGWSLGEATDPVAEWVGSGDTAMGDPSAAHHPLPPPTAVGDPGAAHHPHPPSPRDTAVGDPNTARPLPRARFAACDIVGRDSNAVL